MVTAATGVRRLRTVVARALLLPKSPAPISSQVPQPQEVGATFLLLRAVRQCAAAQSNPQIKTAQPTPIAPLNRRNLHGSITSSFHVHVKVV